VDLRTHTKLEQSIGYFLNTVVLRQQFEAGQTFQEVLEQVKDTQLTAFANKDVEFEKLVTHLRPNRDISYNPIFQTMFVMWDANNTEPSIPDLTLKTIKLDPNIAKFDLTLYAQVNADNTLLLAFEYATSLFYPETMQRLMRIYETMLESIIVEPTVPINTLNWLPAEQKQIVLSEWTDTEADFPQDVCIHDLIASHDANKIAIRYDGKSVTYGDLNQRANQIAHYLIEQGVIANTPVGIMVERSIEMLVGIVAILKAGGAYVPIDPAYPDDRIAFLLQDSGISILLTQSHLDVNDSEITGVNLDETAQFDSYSHNTPQAPVTPNDLAYIIYTSGSTGTPKGVRATHRNLVHSTTARFDVYEHEIGRFLLLSSFAFDSSLVGIFWTLAGGGTLVLPPHGGEHDVKLISRMIQQEQVTHLLALSSLYSILLEFSDSDTLNSLNTVMVAGEACPPELVKTHFTQLPDARLYNEYGPTEGTVWATVSEILPETKHVTIGHAIPNVQTYIVDSHLQAVPIGMHGELLIGGEGITQGYHQRPELTDERFIDNPFGTGRLYRTGDLARYLPNGEIDFLGRIDRQVKVSGYRIELGEIESALLAYDGVRESVVLPVTEQNTRLVAFITTQDDVDKTALRSHLGTQLPQYMIPSVIQVLEAIPRTPNGKINYQALLQQVETEPIPVVSADPRDVSEVEAQLIVIWEELLETQITSVDDNFFNIGGYSLLAIRLLGRINQAFEVDLPTTAIMQAPTIAQIAELIQSDNQAQDAIVRLSDVEDGLPIYCLQVNRFGVLHYQTLIEALRDSYPIYGVTIPNADDYDQITIEQSAQIFADAILKQGLAQPIVLVGLSVSGVVAYEVARLLKPHDIRVHVVMIDTQGPQYPSYQSAFDVLPKKANLIAQEFANETLSNWGSIIYEMVWIVQFRLRFQLRKRANWVLTKLNLPVIANKDMEDLRLGGEHVSDLKDQYFAQNPTDET
ncbi:MAG: amino acid adenylation domain-containing protein, partial [Chloroflexota bacterium]